MRRLLLGCVLAVGCSSSGGGGYWAFDAGTSGEANDLGGIVSDGATVNASDGASTQGGFDAATTQKPQPDLRMDTQDLAPSITGYGSIYASVTQWSGQSFSVADTVVGAYFEDNVISGGSPCTTTMQGACTITSCTGGSGGGGATPEDGGQVTVSGAGQSASAVFGGSSYQSFVDNMAAYWTGGELLSMSAAGATAPAFSDTITMPNQVMVSSPSLPATGQSLDVVRGTGQTFVWSGGGEGTVVLTLAVVVGSASSSVTCEYPASQGTGSLPASVLSQLPSGSGSFSVYAKNAKTVIVGNWSMLLWAYINAIDPSSASFAGQAVVD